MDGGLEGPEAAASAGRSESSGSAEFAVE